MQNLHRRFDRYYIGQIYGGDFAKIWRSQKSRYMNFTNRTIHLEIFLLQDPYNRKWGIINREQKFRLFSDSTVRLIECF